jgi:hypothetical protein
VGFILLSFGVEVKVALTVRSPLSWITKPSGALFSMDVWGDSGRIRERLKSIVATGKLTVYPPTPPTPPPPPHLKRSSQKEIIHGKGNYQLNGKCAT